MSRILKKYAIIACYFRGIMAVKHYLLLKKFDMARMIWAMTRVQVLAIKSQPIKK